MTDSKRPETPLSDALEKLWQGVVDAIESLVAPPPQPIPVPIRGGRRRR
ncbi:MAG: hypothetical protein H6719_14360 [Sandaracinaceae bacterium]|nr:hypothetical protein [Sandaracinaceae bacterium]